MVYKGIAKKLALLAVLVMTTGNAVWAAQSDSAGKEADPAFSVPVVQNPINSGPTMASAGLSRTRPWSSMASMPIPIKKGSIGSACRKTRRPKRFSARTVT